MEHNQDISSLLSELLLNYDCVIVPELGGFVTEYRSARIDKQLNILHPPSKDLRFNAQLTKNDGLLANALSQSSAISHEEANAVIKDSVSQYFCLLEEGQPVNFDKVGVLYLDSKRNIQFRAEESVNFLLDSFRLKKVYASPAAVQEAKQPVVVAPVKVQEPVIKPVPVPMAKVRSEKEMSSPVVEETPVVVMTEKQSSGSARKWLAAALIPLLFYIGYVAVVSDVVHDGQVQASDLNPFKHSDNEQVYTERSEAPSFEETTIPFSIPKTKPEQAETETMAEEPVAEATSVSEPEPAIESTPGPAISPADAVNTYVAPVSLASLEYHIVGGCFAELSNAENFVKTLRDKGFPAHIIDEHHGLHRVAYGSYIERAEALQTLSAIKQDEQLSAWLLRKK